jgi:hypothetical protein
MKKILLCTCCILFAAGGVARAAVLAYEGFAYGSATEHGAVNAFQDGLSVGLSSAWNEILANGAEIKSRTSSWGWDGALANLTAKGITYPLKNSDGYFNFIECNSWNVEQATASLATPIDMTGNGTWYMSFVASSGWLDYASQMGLNDGTNELRWGNGYAYGTKGVTARYGLIGGSLEGTSSTSPTMANGFDVILYVAKLDNVVGTGLNVNVYAYDLNTITSAPSSSDVPLWSTTVSSPTNAFTNLEFYHTGGSNMWAGIGQLRVGTTLSDVVGVPEPSTIVMLVLGVLGIAFYARRK